MSILFNKVEAAITQIAKNPNVVTVNVFHILHKYVCNFGNGSESSCMANKKVVEILIKTNNEVLKEILINLFETRVYNILGTTL